MVEKATSRRFLPTRGVPIGVQVGDYAEAMVRYARVVATAASFAMACASSPPLRQTVAANARNDDPWLQHGVACPPDDPEGEAALKIEDLVVGTGTPVGDGQTVRVHYTAAPTGGATIHDSRDDGPPVEIIVGSTKTVCGLAKALPGMRAGGQRRVLVPWALAFGENGRSPDVQPRTDLVFVIDLYLPAETASGQGGPPPRPASGMRRR
jgi:peptidylprolyl isomerase